MAIPTVTVTRLGGSAGHTPLVLGPSLGTSAAALWGRCADLLADKFEVFGWDLPGHGASAPAHDGFSMADLAAGVLAAVDFALGGPHRSADGPGHRFAYAGDSIGGAVGLQLLLDAPTRVTTATLACTGARIGTVDGWRERAGLVRSEGTSALLDATPARWFGPGFVEREPATARALLDALRDADGGSYAAACDALAEFDVRDRLDAIIAPVLAIAGANDAATPPAGLQAIAAAVSGARLVTLDGVGHLAPAEAPELVAALIAGHDATTTYDAGMAVRREVLGAEHVDRASAAASEFTREFQEFITTYAWGSIWTRPGLDRRSRSMITITALVANGHHEELALHLRGAIANGLTQDEIKEVLLQSAIYCGVPSANTAFRIADRFLSELSEDTR